MDYKLNGTDLPLEPTTALWKERASVGIAGNGIPKYEPVQSFEFTWGLMSRTEFASLRAFYFNASGTRISATLPDPDYTTFFSVTGVVINEPTAGVYFSDTVTGVRLLLTNVRVASFPNL